MSKRTALVRVDINFAEDMKAVMKERLMKGLALPKLEELSLREATALMRRTQNYQNVLGELKTKPKRR